MATRWAVASGNWSALATWDGGASLPGAADDVFADGKTVTIDQDVTVLSIRNTQRSGGTLGGGFTCSTTRTITASGLGLVSQNALLLSITGTGNVTINATVNAPAVSNQAINTSTSGTVTINGNINGATGTANSVHTITASSGPIVVVGNVTGGGSGTSYCINSTGASTSVTVTGNIIGGAGSSAINMTGASAVLTVTGNISCNSSATGAVAAVSLSGNSALKWHSVIGNISAANSLGASGSHGVIDTNNGGGGLIHGGNLTDSTQGDCAVNVRRYRCISTAATTRVYTNSSGYPTGGTITYGSQDYIPSNVPLPADVRSGVSYGSGTFTGTCAVPAAGSVAYGVAVDNTTGTATLSPSDVAALVGAQIVAALNSTP